jgi:hypothetical protein
MRARSFREILQHNTHITAKEAAPPQAPLLLGTQDQPVGCAEGDGCLSISCM